MIPESQIKKSDNFAPCDRDRNLKRNWSWHRCLWRMLETKVLVTEKSHQHINPVTIINQDWKYRFFWIFEGITSLKFRISIRLGISFVNISICTLLRDSTHLSVAHFHSWWDLYSPKGWFQERRSKKYWTRLWIKSRYSCVSCESTWQRSQVRSQIKISNMVSNFNPNLVYFPSTVPMDNWNWIKCDRDREAKILDICFASNQEQGSFLHDLNHNLWIISWRSLTRNQFIKCLYSKST